MLFGYCGDGGVLVKSVPHPLAARLPSHGDPLLISPWEGRGMARGRGDVLLLERLLLRGAGALLRRGRGVFSGGWLAGSRC